MTDQDRRWELDMQNIARNLPYPQTPDLMSGLRHEKRTQIPYRHWLQVAAIVALVLIGMMAVPGIRAAVLEFLRIGAIEIHLTNAPITNTAEPTPLASVLNLPGETTLENARQQFGLPIQLPTYPEGLGEPSRVYSFDGIVVLVWLGDDGQVRFSLHLIPSNMDMNKYYLWHPEAVDVDGRPALWLENIHLSELFGNERTLRRVITASVLVWERDGVTYRLETDLPLGEAIRIAESLE